jgi:hypothetical protein
MYTLLLSYSAIHDLPINVTHFWVQVMCFKKLTDKIEALKPSHMDQHSFSMAKHFIKEAESVPE